VTSLILPFDDITNGITADYITADNIIADDIIADDITADDITNDIFGCPHLTTCSVANDEQFEVETV